MSETRQPYTTTGDKTMRVGDEEYKSKLRRCTELEGLEQPTWREAKELARLKRELAAAEMVHWRKTRGAEG